MHMFPSRSHTGGHSYSIVFPQNHNFTLSKIVTRMEHATKEFDVEISRDGRGYVQYAVDSNTDIGPALRAILTSADSQCTITPKPPMHRRYVSIASMKKEMFSYSAVGQSIHSALTMLQPDEALSIQARFRSLGRLKRFNEGRNKVVVSVTIRFTGSTHRLRQLIPETTSRRKWKVASARRARRIPHLMDVRSLDFVLPAEIMRMRESEGIRSARHYLPPSGDEIAFEGIRDSDGHLFQTSLDSLTCNTIVAGGTGTGKTTALANIAAALIASGRQVLVIDPHGDLGKKLLTLIPGEEANRLLYVDPIRSPVGLNPINVLSGDGIASHGASLMSDSIGYVVRRTYGENTWGNRMGYLFKLVLQALASVDRANFVDVMQVLNNRASREQLLNTVGDKVLKDLLKNEMESYSNEWVMPIKDKLGMLILDVNSRSVLCKRDNNIDLSGLMRDGRSVILDADMTKIGREISSILGSLILSIFWLRASSVRNGLTIIVDEFQNYPLNLLKDIAEGGRKYDINMIIASQSPSALTEQYLNSFATNFQNKLLFRLGREDAFKASRLVDGVDYNELISLPNLQCMFSNTKGNASLSLSPITADTGAVEDAVQSTRSRCSSWDDSSPSIFGLDEAELFYMLQGVRTAETVSDRTVEGLKETGFLKLIGRTKEEFVTMLKLGRKERLVDTRSLKLTKNGREQLLVLQGESKAGGEEHRLMALRAKDLLETYGYIAYILAQRMAVSSPDMIAIPANGHLGRRLLVEIEHAANEMHSSFETKLTRARREESVLVLVFDDEGKALQACKLTNGAAMVLLFTEEDVKEIALEYEGPRLTKFTGRELEFPNLTRFARKNAAS